MEPISRIALRNQSAKLANDASKSLVNPGYIPWLSRNQGLSKRHSGRGRIDFKTTAKLENK